MNKVRFSASCENDLDQIWLYIAQDRQDIEIATRVVETLTERCWLLASNPHLGRSRLDLAPDLRSLIVGNYVILYSVSEDGCVLVHHVVDGRRDYAP